MAANTANRRVLVTNKDGSQSVQTIEQELSMKGGRSASAKEDMKARLARQGVHAENLEVYGGYEDVQQARNPRRGLPVSLCIWCWMCLVWLC
ncbi:hypothetical protein EON65_34375 [archaeon]|nr:MAG: hypothetical protein EON65_34375 [archaeon]